MATFITTFWKINSLRFSGYLSCICSAPNRILFFPGPIYFYFFYAIGLKFHYTGFLMPVKEQCCSFSVWCLFQLLPVSPLPLSSLLNLCSHLIIIICDVLCCFNVSWLCNQAIEPMVVYFVSRAIKETWKGREKIIQTFTWEHILDIFYISELKVDCDCILIVLTWQVPYTVT